MRKIKYLGVKVMIGVKTITVRRKMIIYDSLNK